VPADCFKAIFGLNIKTKKKQIFNLKTIGFSTPASHGYMPNAPGTIAVNVTWMKRGFNAY